MKENFDYNEYDILSLALKENESLRLLEYYAAFGWQEYERCEDKRYFDIIHIKLLRRHKIPNKDRLQLLQVKMENVVNRFAFARKTKHSRSIIIALSLGIFSLGLLSISIYLLINQVLPILSISLFFVVLGISVGTFLAVRRIVKRENSEFMLKFKEMTSDIARIISRAKKLYRGESCEE